MVVAADKDGVPTKGADDYMAAGGILVELAPPAPSDRRLDHTELPHVYLDATYLHVRNSHWQVVSMAVVVATGIPADGAREVLGLDVGDSEEEEFWRTFLTELKKRLWRDVTVSTVYPHASAHPRQP